VRCARAASTARRNTSSVLATTKASAGPPTRHELCRAIGSLARTGTPIESASVGASMYAITSLAARQSAEGAADWTAGRAAAPAAPRAAGARACSRPPTRAAGHAVIEPVHRQQQTNRCPQHGPGYVGRRLQRRAKTGQRFEERGEPGRGCAGNQKEPD